MLSQHPKRPGFSFVRRFVFWIGLALLALLAGDTNRRSLTASQTPEIEQEKPPATNADSNAAVNDQKPSFQRDVRPILSDKCFQCHGPDQNARMADLRLDDRMDAIDDRGGYRVIDERSPEDSELLARIFTDDPDLQMPPPESNKRLSDEERETLSAWVLGGAEYEQHWAFVPPQKSPIPVVTLDGQRTSNPIDVFVIAKMREQGLTPNPRADRPTLARRVSLDLIGLPPTREQLETFLRDSRIDAYERYVDQLIASPQYGERWARRWLDLARYSDTNGYEKDKPRSIWPYRDWVIDTLNLDPGFDQFTIDQLAGDLLSNPSPSQQIATGFHRNTMTNEEGGVDPQEFRFLSIVDRVSTTGTVWLGLTLGCAQCHSHKFDPISQTEYYGLFAYFNNADEPMYRVRNPKTEQERNSILQRIANMEAALPDQFELPAEKAESRQEGSEAQSPLEQFEEAFQAWRERTAPTVNRWRIARPTKVESNMPIVTIEEDGSVLALGDVTKSDVFAISIPIMSESITAVRLEVLADERLPYGGPGRSSIQAGVEKGGDFYLSDIELSLLDSETSESTTRLDQRSGRRFKFRSGSHSYSGDKRAASDAIDDRADTGWGVAGRTAQNHWAVFALDESLPGSSDTGQAIRIILRHRSFYPSGLGRFRISFTSDDQVFEAVDMPARIQDLLAVEEDRISTKELEELRRYFALTTPGLKEARAPINRLRQRLPKFPTTLVMQEREPQHARETFRHHRGEFLQPREQVPAGIPAVLDGSTSPTIRNRLDFARWLVASDQPLTPRVVVNRHWHAFFGTGIVNTVEDFGYQGESPSHPELLDWLAVDLIENDWSIKRLHRMIVTSDTYRQSSGISEEKLKLDPKNRWLSRSPRVRLDAEQIRDSVLIAAKLMSRQIGGPSVFPPQPPGITEATYSRMPWVESQGADRYRRGIYAFTKRTAPYAMFSLFDGPSGEACVARRTPTNTPLQALTLFNDAFLVEAAREMARSVSLQQPRSSIVKQADARDRESLIISDIFERCLSRRPTQVELERVIRFVDLQRSRLSQPTYEAHTIANAGSIQHWCFQIPFGTKTDTQLTKPEVVDLATWTLLCRSLFNLDEMISKP